MKTICTEFFFVYLRAENHNKVATIIFYFAGAGSLATVGRDRLCFTVSGHSKSRRENDDQFSEGFESKKLTFCTFLKT
jgi:hypothetical protein